MIGKRLLMMLSGILFFQILPLQSQTKLIQKNNWVSFFSSQPRASLEFLADSGWIQKKPGNKFYTILIDTSFYNGVSWEQLDIALPLYGSYWFAFKDSFSQEQFLFYAYELEIHFVGIDSVKITHKPFQNPFSNLENTDLGSFFNNKQLHRSKKDREVKLKEKKNK